MADRELVSVHTRNWRYQAAITCRLVETSDGPRPQVEVDLFEVGTVASSSQYYGDLQKAEAKVANWCADQ